jgi:hypothetical protein
MVTIPWCMYFKHVAKDSKRRGNGEIFLACAAFPNGILDEIISDRVRHDKPYPGEYFIDHRGVIRYKWFDDPGEKDLDTVPEELTQETGRNGRDAPKWVGRAEGEPPRRLRG